MHRPTALLPLLGVLLAFQPAGPAAAQEPPGQAAPPTTPRITVVGKGEASAAPDLARLRLTVLRVAPEAADATRQGNEATEAVIRALREEFGLEERDVQTAGFQVTPQYRYANRADGTQEPPVVTGYEVRNTVSARVRDLGLVGRILDRAVALGVNEGGNLELTLDDPTALADAARAQAVERARGSAEAMAEAAGLKLGRVLRIEDRDAAGPGLPSPVAEMRMAASAGAGSVPIALGETSVSAEAQVTFELVP